MRKDKMERLCDKLVDANAVWEATTHGLKDSRGRRHIVECWMWCALMHLDALGYDVVQAKRNQRKGVVE